MRFSRGFDQGVVNAHYRRKLDQGKLLYGGAMGAHGRYLNATRYFNFSNKLVLDVGCGRGDFAAFLHAKGEIPWFCLGIDVLQDMVIEARKRQRDFPHFDFSHADYMEQNWTCDIVVAFSVFDRKFGNTVDSHSYVRKMVEKMVLETTEGAYITFLSAYKTINDTGELLFYPEEMFKFIRTLRERVVLDCSYMPHSFSIITYTEESPWRESEGSKWK